MKVVAGDKLHKRAMIEGKRVEVFLDGMPVDLCILADDEAGVVEFAKTYERGLVVAHDGNVVFERRYGKVEIRVSDIPPGHRKTMLMGNHRPGEPPWFEQVLDGAGEVQSHA